MPSTLAQEKMFNPFMRVDSTVVQRFTGMGDGSNHDINRKPSSLATFSEMDKKCDFRDFFSNGQKNAVSGQNFSCDFSQLRQ